MRIHLIAIGGSIMHNLALALNDNGHTVTGSDDVIYGISKIKLEKAQLLPEIGWNEARITNDIDLIILGMHAQIDNPELRKAQSLNLPIQSFPQFVGNHFKDKRKVVIAGSHGKTSTTSMIMHVLQCEKIEMDYLVGAQLEGFDQMVRLSEAPIAIIEGDEYLSSKLDPSPKFMHYNPDITIITGVAWDHMNVFPTKENYILQFENYIKHLHANAKIYFDKEDVTLTKLVLSNSEVKSEGYEGFNINDNDEIKWDGNYFPIEIFGHHNRKNLKAAFLVCTDLGVKASSFFKAIASFKGAKQRLEKLDDSVDPIVYRDFAHAPSKVAATVKAIKEKFPNKRIAVLAELHTYSSLNKAFLPEYKNALEGIEKCMVCYDPAAVKIKKLENIDPIDIQDAFNHSSLEVGINQLEVLDFIEEMNSEDYEVVLILGSGNLFGIDIKAIFS